MSQTTEKQSNIFNMIKKAICESVEESPVNKGAIEITTPFVDWKGYPLSIYITNEGKITDGGETINQMKSLRVIEDFEEWVLQEDFFQRYQIQRNQDRLEPSNPESAEAIVAYLQGIARLPSFFEPKPIRSPADYYPVQVREIAASGLIEKYQLSALEAEIYINPRPIVLKSGLQIKNDMSPKREDNIIKIISHATSLPTTQKEHVSHKILEPILLKEERKVDVYVVLRNLDDYPKPSRNLLKSKTDEIIQTIYPDSKYELARILVEA